MAMFHEVIDVLFFVIPQFCFGYPFVMAWYWMAGGLLFYATHERHLPPQNQPPDLAAWPPLSIIVPCYNEMAHAEETLTVAAASDYPDFEIVAVNDGSGDETAEVLNALVARIPRLRVAHLAENQGKAIALNAGALLANHEILVCIDGDALLDPHALRWIARAFLPSNVGGVAGNPRIRNRTTILGRLQVGEFSSIMGLIKRAQTMYGRLFTVSGVICAFRKSAIAAAGWWSPRTLTDDVDITWRIQMKGWRVVYEPNAVVWILMPETLLGLWRQRLRWAEGGAQAAIDFFWPLLRRGAASGMSVIYIDFVVSVIWAYTMVFSLGLGLLWALGLVPPLMQKGFQLVPQWWGLTLAVTYLAQAIVAHLIERRYEAGMLRTLFWIIWYPLAFWLLSALTTVVALPRAIFRARSARTTWVSPDRGLR
jgi:biofilm PGA synthesis N-glycosyltransferase PgaC